MVAEQECRLDGMTGPIAARFVSADEARHLVGQWDGLYRTAGQDNPFYAPWALLPALERFAGPEVQIALIFKGEVLCGLLPVQRETGYAKLPVKYWRAWKYPHCYLTSPLLRAGCEAQVLDALIGFLGAKSGASFLQLPLVREETLAVLQGLKGAFQYSPRRYDRAALFPAQSAAAYFESAIRGKKRKEYRRQRRRLEECGHFSVRALTDNRQAAQWTNDFLALEKSGWKGSAQTALAFDEDDTGWFKDAISGAAENNAVEFLRMDIDGKPAAMLAGFRRGGEINTIKICHDPEYAKYSPGVLIELEATERFLSEPGFQRADSCAAPDHPMIEKIWRDSMTIFTANIAGENPMSQRILKLCRQAEKFRNLFPKPYDGFNTEV